jgi:uncharacterized phage infection (PIP) family protein YhgE
MSNRKITQSLRERTKSALERISSIEEDLGRLQQGVSQMLTQVQQQVASLQESLNAVIQSVGQDEIQNIITENRRKAAEDRADAAKKEIEELVTKGTLVPAETVGDDSFLTGHDVDEKGETVHPGFGHVHFKQVKPELQEKVKGSKIGAKISTAPADKADSEAGFVIDAIYTFIPPKPPEEVEKAAEVAADAAAQAEAEAQVAAEVAAKAEGEKK